MIFCKVNDDLLDKYIISNSNNIINAMKKIDSNAKGFLFVIDVNGKLMGSVTDGDIRRWIIKTGDLNATIDCAMKTNPIYISVHEDEKRAEELIEKYNITSVPVINDDFVICSIFIVDNLACKKKKKEIRNLPDTNVIIMAGGRGTRLYPYTKILPKPLIPIGETPIVERIMNKYCEFGISQYYMTVNYKKEMIRYYFSDKQEQYNISYIEEEKPLGTAGSIKLIKDVFLKPLFVTNCDTLILADYYDIYEHHNLTGNDVTVVAALKNIIIPYGVLKIGEDGIIDSIEEKPTQSYIINTGMYVINPDIIKLIPDNQVYHMTDLIEKVLELDGKVGIYPISEDSFLDMGEMKEMKRMEEKLHIVSEQ